VRSDTIYGRDWQLAVRVPIVVGVVVVVVVAGDDIECFDLRAGSGGRRVLAVVMCC
jgi:hypothetical protein